jgi:outer membrane lipoprotein-sorting protein
MLVAVRWFRLSALLPLALFAAGLLALREGAAQTRVPDPKKNADEDLLTRIWNGIQGAQTKYTTACGTITETRTSKLLKVPLVFHGKFCASGMDKFFLEYSDPEPVRLVFNQDFLSVGIGQGHLTTEVIEIGKNVRKTQAYFSRENSIRNLKESFSIVVSDSPGSYELRFTPRSQRFKQKLNYLVVTLRKDDFLLRSLEIDGTSGVNSKFRIEMGALNVKLNEEMFKVRKQ